jgi:hypothetical protein
MVRHTRSTSSPSSPRRKAAVVAQEKPPVTDLRTFLRKAEPTTLLLLLLHGGADVQEAVCNEVGRRVLSGPLPVLPALLRELAMSPVASVRAAAIDALGKIGDVDAGPLLTQVLANQSEPIEVRDTAAYALGHLKYAPARDTLLGSLADREPSVRLCAVAALAALGDESVRRQLILLASVEQDATVRDAIGQAVAQLTPVPTTTKLVGPISYVGTPQMGNRIHVTARPREVVLLQPSLSAVRSNREGAGLLVRERLPGGSGDDVSITSAWPVEAA